MNNVNQILDDIRTIQEAAYDAHDDVHSKINDFAEKVGVMEQCGLNVMSDDSTMQNIIDNREQVIFEYQNEGHKKINRRLIGMVNWVLPIFKKLQVGIEQGTLRHQEIDHFNSSVLKLFFAPTIAAGDDYSSTLKTAHGRTSLRMFKNIITKARKTHEYSNDEIKILDKCYDAIENWKRISKYDRDSRSFYDRWIAYDRDTRELDSIKKATDELVTALEDVKALAKSHFDGTVQEAVVGNDCDSDSKEEKENAKEEKAE